METSHPTAVGFWWKVSNPELPMHFENLWCHLLLKVCSGTGLHASSNSDPHCAKVYIDLRNVRPALLNCL